MAEFKPIFVSNENKERFYETIKIEKSSSMISQDCSNFKLNLYKKYGIIK